MGKRSTTVLPMSQVVKAVPILTTAAKDMDSANERPWLEVETVEVEVLI